MAESRLSARARAAAAERDGSEGLVDPRTLARLKGLSVRSRRVVDGVLQGQHKSPHHGSSIEFAEHKEYSPGDEIKHIDWKAYARLDKLTVKKFEQETNLRAYLVVDTSASMAYGAEGALTKLDYASVLATSLAYLLLRQQDAVALVTFAETVRKILPPHARSGYLSVVAEALEGMRPEGTTDLAVGLAKLSELGRKRGLVFVMSDGFGDLDAAFRVLRQLAGRGHQVTFLHVLDGDELRFPFDALTLFEGLEQGAKILVEPRAVRERYLEQLEAHRSALRSRCLEVGITYELVDTSEPPGHHLLQLLARHDARAGRARGARSGARR